jgi:hypothetical protein
VQGDLLRRLRVGTVLALCAGPHLSRRSGLDRSTPRSPPRGSSPESCSLSEGYDR